MKKYIDLGVSIFNPEFTLNPYRYLNELYDREDVLGFSSEGMNFLFRFKQCRAVMFNKHCPRGGSNSEELKAVEALRATRYPTRAAHFQHSYTHGEPNLKFKAAIGRFVANVAESACFDGAQPIFEKLAQGGKLNNYITDVSHLPMRIFLDTCLLPYDEAQLNALHDAGCAFLKSLENFSDEELVKACDKGLATIQAYMRTNFYDLDPASPIHDLINDGRESGMSDEKLIANIGGMFLTSISNTIGISSAFILRTLINAPHSLQLLKNDPGLANNEQVITELLRRDNHVKSLSRQVNESIDLGRFNLDKGELIFLFFPGINMDNNQWENPTQLNFNRQFTGENNIIFGGSFYTCIGRKLTMAFLRKTISGFISYLPSTAKVIEEELEIDGSWMAERIIKKMPIQL